MNRSGPILRRRPAAPSYSPHPGAARRMAASSRDGMVLLIVLVAVALLSLAAYTFCDLMITQQEAAVLANQQAQARHLAASGVAWIEAVVSTPGLPPGSLYFDRQRFQAVVVQDDSGTQWRGRFTVLAPVLDPTGQATGIRWGLENESARLHLGLLAENKQLDEVKQRECLMHLPGMDPWQADAILDWIDGDTVPREYGAEAEYYVTLHPAYEPKDGPLEALDELLRVRGVLPEWLYGRDADRNRLVDAYEASRPLPAGVPRLESDSGWASYLTLYSAERNVNAQGKPRINVNADDLELLYKQLTSILEPDWATFIIAYRQNGPQSNASSPSGQPNPTGPSSGAGPNGQQPPGGPGNATAATSAAAQPGGGGGYGAASPAARGGPPAGPGGPQQAKAAGEPVRGRQVDLKQPGGHRIEQLLDLIGAQVQVTFPGGPQPTLLDSPFVEDPAAMRSYLPVLMDQLTTADEPVLRGRVDINQAPLPVLLAIPNMTEEAARQIVEQRGGDPSDLPPSRQVPTWPLVEGIVTLEEMKKLLPFVTTRGDVYRAQVVGFFDAGGPFTRVEVVVDATGPKARLLSWKELNHLGRGYSREVLGAVQP